MAMIAAGVTGGDSAHRGKFRVVRNMDDFDPVPHRHAQHRIGNIVQVFGLFPANRAVFRHVAVEMSAVRALRGGGGKIPRQQQGLHLAGFQRLQHSPQAGRSTPVAVRFPNRFPHQAGTALGAELVVHGLGAFPHLADGGRRRVNREMPHETLPHIRVQMRLDFPEVLVAASDQEPLVAALLQFAHAFRQALEPVQRLVFHVTLGVPGIVARETVAAAAARQQRHHLADGVAGDGLLGGHAAGVEREPPARQVGLAVRESVVA